MPQKDELAAAGPASSQRSGEEEWWKVGSPAEGVASRSGVERSGVERSGVERIGVEERRIAKKMPKTIGPGARRSDKRLRDEPRRDARQSKERHRGVGRSRERRGVRTGAEAAEAASSACEPAAACQNW